MTTLQLPSNLASDYKGVQLIDIRNQLPVNPHYTWAQLAGVRDIATLNTLVSHHDAIPKHKSAKYSDIELAIRIARDHINSKKNHPNGDAGFPYDVWIRNGIIYWTNDIEQREYGVASNNGYTVNVCVSGDYHNYDTLTPEDRRALYVAIIMLKEAVPAIEHIKGHGELVPTNCPGYDIKVVREDVSSLEEQLEYHSSPSADRALAYAFAERIENLGNKFKHERWGEPAKAKVMLLEPVIYQMGYNEKMEVTPEGIVKRVVELFNNSAIEKYKDSGFKKLIIGANRAKEVGLL